MQITSLHGILARQLAERPDASAAVLGERDLDWSTLAERTRRLANGLADLGVEPGSRVALLDGNALEYFEFMFATASLRATAVVLNWRLTASELSFILGDAAPVVLVVRQRFLDAARRAVGAAGIDVRLLVLDAEEGEPDYEDWLQAQSDRSRDVVVRPDDVVIQMYTSGTTGTPKGALLDNANVAALLRASGEWRMDASSVNLAAMPLFHIGGGGWALSGMAHGARTVLVADLDPARLLATIARHEVTHAFLVPAVIQMLLEEPDDVAVPSLGFLAYGASPISEAVLRRSIRRFDTGLCQLYGMTESTGAVVQLDPEDHATSGPKARLLRSAGRAMPDVELRIVAPDGDGEQPLPDGEVGEVWIRTPSIMRGYRRNPEATERALHPDGWFRSGDLGHLEDGYLFLSGRLNDMIISGGENVYPAELESTIMDHPAVLDVGVVGVPSPRWGETPRAVVVLREGVDASAADLQQHCREHLAGYKCPSEFLFVDELPRNESGKVRKDVLAGLPGRAATA